MTESDDIEVIREVMESPQHVCEYEYLPDDDGTTYTCGSDFDVEKNRYFDMFLCRKHRSYLCTKEY
jgi:uncharacterized protein YaiE (UPF0345 family)